jgi:hypothetical protein
MRIAALIATSAAMASASAAELDAPSKNPSVAWVIDP